MEDGMENEMENEMEDIREDDSCDDDCALKEGNKRAANHTSEQKPAKAKKTEQPKPKVAENWVQCLDCSKWRTFPQGHDWSNKRFTCAGVTWQPLKYNKCDEPEEQGEKAQEDYYVDAISTGFSDSVLKERLVGLLCKKYVFV